MHFDVRADQLGHGGRQLGVGHRPHPSFGVEIEVVHRDQLRFFFGVGIHVHLSPITRPTWGTTGPGVNEPVEFCRQFKGLFGSEDVWDMQVSMAVKELGMVFREQGCSIESDEI